jgi:hypothetical protein
VPDTPDEKVIGKYLKAVRVAAEGSGPEANTAKEIVKKLIDKYPNLPFHAAAKAADDAMHDRVKQAEQAARAAGVAVAPSDMQGLLDGLLARTSSIVGSQLSASMEAATKRVLGDIEGYVQEVFGDQFKSDNVYLRDNLDLYEVLDSLAETMDPDDNMIALDEMEDGEPVIRIEISLPLSLVEAAMATDINKVKLLDWLLDPVFEDLDTDEEEL